MPNPAKVTITVNNKTYSIEPGTYSLRDFEQQVGLKQTASLSVGSRPALATTIKGNDSFQIIGGEVITSTQGV